MKPSMTSFSKPGQQRPDRVMYVVHRLESYIPTSIFFRISVLGGCRGQVGGTRFQVGMTGADQCRYLRPEK